MLSTPFKSSGVSRVPGSVRARHVERSDVHVTSAVRADTGWVMRLKIVGVCQPPLEVTVRVPADEEEDETTTRIMKAVCARLDSSNEHASTREDRTSHVAHG